MYGINNPGAVADGVSEEAEELFNQLRDSQQPEYKYVAEALNEIAWNGDGWEKDDYLIVSAEKIAQAAEMFASNLREYKRKL